MSSNKATPKRHTTKLRLPCKVGSITTGYVTAIPGDTGRDLYRWDEEHRLLIISAEQSEVGQQRALLQALLEWSVFHLEGMEIIDHQLILHEIEEIADLLLEMLSMSGLYAVSPHSLKQDRKEPQFEYKKQLRSKRQPAVDYARRGKNWKKHPSMVATREQRRDDQS